jgi:hypothetical protein
MTSSVLDRRSRLAATFASCACTLALAGCEESAEIRVREVPKMVIEVEEFAGIENPQDTILAAMVPQGREAWVFRLSGATKDVASQQEAFETFIGSLSLGEGPSLPEWDLPAGWEVTAAPPGALRAASIRVPLDDDRDLDLSISRLPIHEDWLHYRLRNINRWRRQLQLPVAGASEMDQASQTVPLAKAPSIAATIIALKGILSDSGPGSMAMRMPEGHPPTGAGEVASPAASGLTYETPTGWEPGPSNSVRRASLVIRDGDAEASVAVTAFPKSGRMADPLANINRWRGEVLLEPIGAGQITDGTEPFEVDGLSGLYIPLDGSGDGPDALATRAVMVERGDLVWFFKLHGPKSLVTRETDHFREFVQTVKFAE